MIMIFGTDIHGRQRIVSTDIGYLLTFHPVRHKVGFLVFIKMYNQ